MPPGTNQMKMINQGPIRRPGHLHQGPQDTPGFPCPPGQKMEIKWGYQWYWWAFPLTPTYHYECSI